MWHEIVYKPSGRWRGKLKGFPEKAGDYLVTWNNRPIEVAHFTKKDHFFIKGVQGRLSVTHWTELPSLPELVTRKER